MSAGFAFPEWWTPAPPPPSVDTDRLEGLAKESARIATVKGLDDKLDATADSLASLNWQRPVG